MALDYNDILNIKNWRGRKEFYGGTFNTADIVLIAKILKDNDKVTGLNLSCQDMGPQGACALAEMLYVNTSIQSLSIEQNKIGVEGASALAHALEVNKTLKELWLRNNDLLSDGTRVIAEALTVNKSLLRIGLENNFPGNEGGHAIINMLQTNRILDGIWLNLNELAPSVILRLCNVLKDNKTLKIVGLSANKLGINGVHALGEIIEHNKCLLHLETENNEISVEGGRLIAKALTKNNTLTFLSLRDNNLRNSACDIAEALESNKTLQTLLLHQNNIDFAGAYSLSKMLNHNHTLTALYLNNNPLTADGANLLADALKNNKGLRTLDLSSTNADKITGKIFAEAMNVNHSFASMNIDNPSLLDEALITSSNKNIVHTGTFSRSKLCDENKIAAKKLINKMQYAIDELTDTDFREIAARIASIIVTLHGPSWHYGKTGKISRDSIAHLLQKVRKGAAVKNIKIDIPQDFGQESEVPKLDSIVSDNRHTKNALNPPNLINIATHKFDVGLSFPGEARTLVKSIADALELLIGPDTYFYDDRYIAQLARPSLDVLLQDIYANRSNLIVVFLSNDYQNKLWCGVEFRAIKEVIMNRNFNKVMFVKMDDGKVDGVFKTDGYVDANKFTPAEIAEFINARLRLLK